VNPIGRPEYQFDLERERNHDVADDQDHEIRRRIVCAVMAQFLTAMFATIENFKKSTEQAPFPAVGAAPPKAAAYRQHCIARRSTRISHVRRVRVRPRTLQHQQSGYASCAAAVEYLPRVITAVVPPSIGMIVPVR
jgi:hypothetical protein